MIRVEHVYKKFCRSLRRGMLHTSVDMTRDFLGLKSPSSRLRKDEFWALQDISFEVKQGQSLAIIGTNGSGKTTMLNLLNGVLMPDQGQIEISGRVGALTEIGAGFHPLLTGRENITINGLMLGMTPAEITAKTAEIIEFAEIGDFIDSPVKYYSSGMYVRLGFGIAIHAPVDILLVDEVLAVGDLAFAIKCMRRIVQFRQQGGAIVLVTHAMHNVKFVCAEALWLEKGIMQEYGISAEVANNYEQQALTKTDRPGEVLLYDARVDVVDFEFAENLQSGEKLTIDATLRFVDPVERPIFLLHLHSNSDDSLVFSHYSNLEGCHWDVLEGMVRLKMTTGPLPLRDGKYKLSFSVSEAEIGNHLIWHHKRYSLQVDNKRDVYGTVDAFVTYAIDKP